MGPIRLGVLLLIVLCGGLSTCFGQEKKGVWDVFQTGARGDGVTMDTRAIQRAIDECHQAGGGEVYLHNGRFLSGTLYLKDHITLHIAAGAVLAGSTRLDDYPVGSSAYPGYNGEFVTGKMLIYAEKAVNIAIIGRGKIDGSGQYFKMIEGAQPFTDRPRIIHFRGCENVLLRDITLYNGGSWIQSYQSCRKMVLDGITVDSRENKDIEKPRYADSPGRNTDGLDLIDCEVVRISNCYINSGDDAICLKSYSPNEACRDITITNCVVSSNASGIKIGTESAGAFEDITVQNCTVFDTRGEALSIISADGARVERINISAISLRNIKGAAIFIRLGSRHRSYRKNAAPQKGILKDITISNVQGTRISGYGCSITGLPDQPVKTITLTNINLEFTDGGKAVKSDDVPGERLTREERLKEINREVPELPQAYPSGRMFGRLPAYGFYVRHAVHVTFENFHLRFAEEDIRPALVCDDVQEIRVQGFKAQATSETPALIRLINVRDMVLAGSAPVTAVPVFLSVSDPRSSNIRLIGNHLENVQKSRYSLEKGASEACIKEIL